MRWLLLSLMLCGVLSFVAFAQDNEDPVENPISGDGTVSGDLKLNVGSKQIYDNDAGGNDYWVVNTNGILSAYVAAGERFKITPTLITSNVSFTFASTATFTATTNFQSHTTHQDADVAFMGNSNDAGMVWSAVQSPTEGGDALILFSKVGDSANSGDIIVTNQTNYTKDHHLNLNTELQLCVFDANTDVDSDATKYGCQYHNGTNYVITAGAGYPFFNGGLMIQANKQIVMGDSSESIIEYETSQTVDTLAIGVGTSSNSLLIMPKTYMTTDYGFAQQDEPSVTLVTVKGAGTHITAKTESVTFAANPGDASKTTTGTAIPYGAMLQGVTTRVTTAGTNCAAYYVGTSADADHFADDSDTGVSQGTTSDNADAQAAFTPYLPNLTSGGVTEIVITGTDGSDGATNCFDMVVEITTHYILPSAATIN